MRKLIFRDCETKEPFIGSDDTKITCFISGGWEYSDELWDELIRERDQHLDELAAWEAQERAYRAAHGE